MSDSYPPPQFGDINPFPPTAVAQVSPIDADVVTIPTAATLKAVGELQDYLAVPAPPAGRVLAIVGNYGSGKTHLAFHLLNTARRSAGDTVQQLFVNAPYGNFVSLYRAFAESLDDRRELVTSRVRHFYANVVADSVAGSELHIEIADRLRSGTVDPVAVVERLGLPESGLLEQVQQKLGDITDNKAFGTALTLLLRDGFEDAVWEWLVGNDPAEILRERGIVDPTTTSERSALDAMSVFAALFGGGRFRFMVVVDELDHLLSASNRPRDEVQAALKQLLQGFLSAGAFLVLAGLPDFLDSLRDDVRGRITRQVTMTPLSTADAVRYIRARQRSEIGADRLFPFTEEVVSYIVDISGGSPRDVVRLCYQLYRRAADQNSAVTDAMVRAVARDVFYGPNTEATHRDIRRTLTAHGLSSDRGNFVNGVPVDYWIPIGSRGAAVAVLVTDAVLDESQLTTLISYVSRLRGAADREVLVVIGGYLSPDYTQRLRDVLQREPIIYEQRDFAADFDAALTGVERRLDRLDAADPAAALHARLERLGQQQSNTLDIVLDLAGRVESFASTSDQRLADLRRQFDNAASLLAAGQAEERPGSTTTIGQLPDRVNAVFDDAINALDVDARLATLFRRMFDDNADAAAARRLVTATLRQPRAHTATGVVTLLRLLTESYRRAVTDWYTTAATDEHGRLLVKHRQRLESITRVFDTFMGFLYVYEASWLTDQLAGGDDRQGALGDSIRSHRLHHVQDELAGLSGRIRTEVLSGFGADPPD